MNMNHNKLIPSLPDGVIFNAYPDSCGENLGEMVSLLQSEEFRDIFSQCYILPSLFNSDLDRGFSIISYDLNQHYASSENLQDLKSMGISLKLDFVLNHLSAQSPQFRDLVEKGESSGYLGCFIDWNKFWQGKGRVSHEGYIIPDEKYLKKP